MKNEDTYLVAGETCIKKLGEKKEIKKDNQYSIIILSIMLKTHFYHGMDIALRPSEFCGVLDVDQHNEEQVVPHVVL